MGILQVSPPDQNHFKPLKRLLPIFVICLHGIGSIGQSFKINTYTTRDGLSSNEVNAVALDKQGFLWIATGNGLNRFDGNIFDVFRHNPADSTSIAGNEVQTIYRDKHDRLWLGTNEGISLYDPVRQYFTNYAPDTTVVQNIGTSFGALCDDSSGNLWVGTKNELLVFDKRTNKFRSSGWNKFAEKNVPASANHLRVIVIGIIPKSANELWVLSTYGLFSVQTTTCSFRFYPYPKPYDYLGCQLKYADESGNVWISLFGAGLLCYHSATGTWSDYHTPNEYSLWDNAYSLKQFGGDTLMYASCGNIIFVSKNNGVINSAISFDNTRNNSLYSVRCLDILRQNNLLWLATSNGLVKIAPRELPLSFFKPHGTHSLSRVYKSATTGKIIYGDDDGSYVYDGKSSIRIPTRKTNDTRYRYFAEAPDGTAYVTDETTLYKYDQQKNMVTEIKLPPKRIPENDFEIRNIVVDRNGLLWVRSFSQGIFSYNPRTGVAAFEENLPHRKDFGTSWMYYDSLTHCLWTTEEFNGVTIYDIGKKTSRHFLLNKPPSQRGAAINCITGNHRGKIWLNSLQSGILEYDNSGSFKLYTGSNGLLSEKVSWITIDNNEDVWIGADDGISRFDTKSKLFTNYYNSEGYPAVFGSFFAADNEGNIYVSADSGFYQWNNKVIQPAAPGGRFYLRFAQMNNETLPVDSVFHFNYSENNLLFQFGWLSLETSQPVQMEYRLNKGAWVSASVHSPVSFASLRPGKYTLAVRLKNDPAHALQLHFDIAFPWWQETSVLVLAGVLILSIIILLVKRRTDQIKRQAALNQQLTESRMTALRSQMNPHFIFNILNSINSFIIENKTLLASNYLNDFSRLVRMVLEHSQKNLIPLGDELKALKLYLELESRRLEGSFDYRIEMENDQELTSALVPPLLIQPFVENAIWHGLRNKKTTGNVEIKISHHKKSLLITVTDDGIGREAAKKLQQFKSDQSFGINATMQRMALTNPQSKIVLEDLYSNEGKPLGTRVYIYT